MPAHALQPQVDGFTAAAGTSASSITSGGKVSAGAGMASAVTAASGWVVPAGATVDARRFPFGKAATSVTHSTADGTNARRDLVVARVTDTVSGTVAVEVVAGTPAASPVDPATPANSVLLGRVTVPAGAVAATSFTYTDLRVVPAAGFSPQLWGIRGDGITDDTAAIVDAVTAYKKVTLPAAPGGFYAIEGTVGIPGGCELELERGAILKRTAAHASTDPVVRMTANNSKLTGNGQVLTEKASPKGIVIFGAAELSQAALCSMASGSTTLTVDAGATSVFVPSDVGRIISVEGAKSTGNFRLDTTIASYVSGTEVTLTAAATATVASAETVWGTTGTNCLWSRVEDVTVTGVQASTNLGIVFNGTAYGTFGTYQNTVRDVFVEKVGVAIDHRPGANANTANGVQSYKIESNVYRYLVTDECLATGGFVNTSVNGVVIVNIVRSFNVRIVGAMAEPGGTATGYIIGAGSQSCQLIGNGFNVAIEGTDSGTDSTILGNTRLRVPTLRTGDGTTAAPTQSWRDEPSSGWIRESAQIFAFIVAAARVLRLTGSGILLDAGKRIQVGTPSIYSGAGSPEGVQSAVPGSVYLRNNGGAATTFYVKESGAAATGWVAK